MRRRRPELGRVDSPRRRRRSLPPVDGFPRGRAEDGDRPLKAPDVFAGAGAVLGEGPCWDSEAERLLWVDILSRRVFVCTAGHTRSFELPDYASAAVPTSSSETLVLALGVGVATLALESAEVTPVALTDSDPGRVRVNDAKVDPAGRLWLGTTAVDEAPGMGALYRLDGDGSMEKVLDGLSVSNGPAWSLDGDAMFHVDSPARSIRRFDFDPADGSLGQGRELVDTSPWSGLPDGMTIDADGNLWVAFWDGGCVRCFSADDGSLLAAVDLPVARPTSCAFGRTGLDRLLVTSATYELSAAQLRDQPLAGSVLSVDVGVSGRAAVPARLPPGPTRGS